MKPFERLLRDVARRSDERAASRDVLKKGAQAALSRWEAIRARAQRRPSPKVLLAAALVVISALIAVRWRPSPALSFVVGPESEPGKLGAWMASPPEGLTLRFSEGTEITLDAGATARISRADPNGAGLLLERGALHANVIHRDSATGWSVHAGPFEIRITGTSFDASWEPAEGTLDVGVSEGRVVVTGPMLDEGRALSSSERMRVSLRSSRLEVVRSNGASAVAGLAPPEATAAPSLSSSAPAPVPPVIDTSSSAAPQAGSAAPSAAPASLTSSERTSAPISWRELARAGKHRAALDAALSAGFDRTLREASGADLLLLADSARFAGDPGHAKQALLAARDRGEKGSTAFLLGKLAADSMGFPGEGAQWFEAYLREAPGGELAEQALGRLIQLYKRAGQPGAARAAASKYMEKYPSGGYAGAARALLEQ